jgi:DNA invertase Pin-like site-specific DNA recombinase
MANALVVRGTRLPSQRGVLRAAQYVRMSTDKQRYSIQNQAAVIAAYAHAHGLQLVREYVDAGESGLRIKNRAGLQRLIADVTSGQADYSHVLVYDVSRWGRFQDTDESAYYEFVCKQAGVKVAYCAEQFDNDGSMLSSIVKNLKRVMAAEYSRELSVKVHAGQSRIVRLGFWRGAAPGYALRRQLVDENEQPKGMLEKGQKKFLQTDRVRLRPGTTGEIAVVRWIFDQCLLGRHDTQIARDLNRKGVPTPSGRPWVDSMVNRVLRNENYIGNIVYNRQSRKLGALKVNNPPDLWVRGEACIEPIIEPEVFKRAQNILGNRRVEIPEGEMLSGLRRLLHKKGRLSPAIIDGASGLPCTHVYIRHFGSLRNAYRLIGYTSERDYTFIDSEQAWTAVAASLARQVSASLEKCGTHVRLGPLDDQLCVEGTVRVLVRVCRSYPKEGLLTQWRVPRINRSPADWIVGIRLTEDNKAVFDYVLIPRSVTKRYTSCMRFTDQACTRLGFDRCDSVEALSRSIRRKLGHRLQPVSGCRVRSALSRMPQ